jgi:riboflavin kinase/FMN adenylyltransferase
MLIFRGLHATGKPAIALTIGNFDGVHLGHQALLDQLKLAGHRLGLQTAVLVFEPHPREFFMPLEAPARLTSMREKLGFLATLDVDRVYVCRFNSSFAQMSAEDFIHALCEKLATKFILIGDDFRFGSRRRGDYTLMKKMGSQQGFEVEAMQSVIRDGVRVSSTAVRVALADGDLHAAERYLGRPYSISGRVIHGDGLGRQLGFPTANIQLKHNRPPLTGIFVVKVQGDDVPSIRGVASLGVRPTVKTNGKPILEVHLFNFSGDLYNKHLRVDFLHKLRDEEKYPDLQSLTRQIELDVSNAKQWFIEYD